MKEEKYLKDGDHLFDNFIINNIIAGTDMHFLRSKKMHISTL